MSKWDVSYSFAWEVPQPTSKTTPSKGAFVTGVAADFVDTEQGDLRLQRGSQAIDRIPASATLPATDIQGCPRPAGEGADPGAYESQPVP